MVQKINVDHAMVSLLLSFFDKDDEDAAEGEGAGAPSTPPPPDPRPSQPTVAADVGTEMFSYAAAAPPIEGRMRSLSC